MIFQLLIAFLPLALFSIVGCSSKKKPAKNSMKSVSNKKSVTSAAGITASSGAGLPPKSDAGVPKAEAAKKGSRMEVEEKKAEEKKEEENKEEKKEEEKKEEEKKEEEKKEEEKADSKKEEKKEEKKSKKEEAADGDVVENMLVTPATDPDPTPPKEGEKNAKKSSKSKKSKKDKKSSKSKKEKKENEKKDEEKGSDKKDDSKKDEEKKEEKDGDKKEEEGEQKEEKKDEEKKEEKKDEDKKESGKMVADPAEVKWDKAKGEKEVKVANKAKVRQAFKVKCSDNKLYNVDPVHGFVEADKEIVIKVKRLGDTAKPDKIVVMFAEAKAEEKDAAALLKAVPVEKQDKMTIPFTVA